MIYIPQLWDKPIIIINTAIKPIITIWAEERGAQERGKFEWGFGDGGENGRCGYTMLANGRVIRGGLTSAGLSLNGPSGDMVGYSKVNLVANGVENTNYHIFKPDDEFTGITVFTKPLELRQGDVLNFRTAKTLRNNAGVGVVSVLIELDLTQ
jgi:hypothetical protein